METPPAEPPLTGTPQVASAETFNAREADEAKAYWSSLEFHGYKQPKPWSEFMAERILAFEPESVFEFGCNVGRNLSALARRRPGIFVAGVDINRCAVAYGRDEQGLPLFCADETLLPLLPAGTYDVAFTVSVLDHVPAPAPILTHLARVSRRAVVLLEPYTGEDGKVVRNIGVSGQWVDTTPYSYSWNYVELVRAHLPDWNVEVRDFPLRSTSSPSLRSDLSSFFKCYTLTRGSPPP